MKCRLTRKFLLPDLARTEGFVAEFTTTYLFWTHRTTRSVAYCGGAWRDCDTGFPISSDEVSALVEALEDHNRARDAAKRVSSMADRRVVWPEPKAPERKGYRDE